MVALGAVLTEEQPDGDSAPEALQVVQADTELLAEGEPVLLGEAVPATELVGGILGDALGLCSAVKVTCMDCEEEVLTDWELLPLLLQLLQMVALGAALTEEQPDGDAAPEALKEVLADTKGLADREGEEDCSTVIDPELETLGLAATLGL